MAARVFFLHDLKEETEEFGEKVKNLLHLISHGFEVAQSFVITNSAYLDFLKENNLDNKIKHLNLAGLEGEIEKHLKDSKLPKSLVREILASYKSLGTTLEDVEVKVNGERITGDAALIEKVRQLFSSSYPTKKLNIVVQKIHFGKHGRVRTSSKFINSIHPFSENETSLLENMISKFKNTFYLPHEIDFTLEKGKVIINKIRPETQNFVENTSQDTGYRVIVNSNY